MNLHVSTPLAAESARRSREFRERIEAIHAYKQFVGVSQEPYWPGMWMWELVTLPSKEPAPIPLARILKAVAEDCGLTRDEIKSPRRLGQLVRARHVVFYLARRLTRLSTPQIGGGVGGRDHTTVLHGCRKIEALLAAGDKQTTDDIAHYLAVLK